ncbi:MAG: T6SS effector BTH_I2691 family protein [Acidihalobacter sp.]|uniref:T6SS effector BTH_I2691 family protein n=1 Tax=Acidihalobacter sp. TaxID=1872108 RepID=UPI00307EC7CF
MAEGNRYSANAQKAASSASPCAAGKCPNCDKQGLAVLLTIPTLAETTYANSVRGTIAPLLDGTADPALAASGYVMRTLREGYVMAFYENDKLSPEIAAQGGWSLNRVHKGGYLTPARFAAAEAGTTAAEAPFSCSRVAGFASALLFTIPKAEHAGKVWVAFSSHPWSAKVREAYAADAAMRDKYMTCIEAAAGTCRRSLALTPDNLSKAVIDFVPQRDPKVLKGNPWPLRHLAADAEHLGRPLRENFPFLRDLLDTTLRPEDAADVYAQAEAAIGSSGALTIANAMIVGLADAEGVTTTAAQRRITLCNSAAEWIADFRDNQGEQNGYWRLQSALSIKGLLALVDNQASDHKKREAPYAHLQGKAVTRHEFDAMMSAHQLPKDARFAPDQRHTPAGACPEGMSVTYADPSRGTIDIPSAERIERDAAKLKQDIRDKLTAKARGMDWTKFLQTYENKVRDDKQRLARLELDHKAWLESDLFRHLYSVDFDDTALVDGLPYASCVNNCLMGGPMTDKALDWWSGFLAQDPSLKHNLLVRALLGNQTAFFGWFTQLSQKATTFDELKGLLDVVREAHAQGRSAGSAQNADGLAQSLLMIATSVAAALDKAGTLGEGLRERLKRLGLSLMGKSEPGLKLYVLRVPLSVAARLWRSMAGATENVLAKSAEVGQRKVKSLVLSGAIALDMAGSAKAADTLVDVYCWSQGRLELKVGKVAGKYTLTTAEVTAANEAPFTLKLTEQTAQQLTRDSMRILRGARTGAENDRGVCGGVCDVCGGGSGGGECV